MIFLYKLQKRQLSDPMRYFLSALLASSLFLSGCSNEQPINSVQTIKIKPDYNQIILIGSRKDDQGNSYHKNSYRIILDSKGNPKAVTKDFGADPIVPVEYEKEFPNARIMSKEQYEELKKLTKSNRDFIYKLELIDSKRSK